MDRTTPRIEKDWRKVDGVRGILLYKHDDGASDFKVSSEGRPRLI